MTTPPPPSSAGASLRQSSARRRLTNRLMLGVCIACAVAVLAPLVAILFYVVTQGARALSPDFFTHLPTPSGEPGGGMANALVGSLILMALACAVGLPIGVGSGIWLAEYGRHQRLGDAVRFVGDVLAGLPSIVAGLVAYGLLVATLGRFSALSGGVALGLLMFPTVMRTTEAVLLLVPQDLRDGALALGARRWQAVIGVVIPAAAGGIATGVILGIARVAGETAPLLFTAFGSEFWQSGVDQPVAALPLMIFTYATSPYSDWRTQAWAAALVLVGLVLLLNLLARFLARRYGGGIVRE